MNGSFALLSLVLQVLGLFSSGFASKREPTRTLLDVELVEAARRKAPKGYRLVDLDVYGESETFRPWNWKPVKVHPAIAVANEWGIKSIHLKPLTVIDEWFHNEQKSTPLTVTFAHKTSHTTEIESRSLDMVRIGTSVSVEASVPLILTGAISVKTHIDMKKDSSSSVATTEELGVNEVITVPPRTSTHVTWTISEHKVEVPWTAQVYISGYVLATYQNDHGVHSRSWGVGELDFMSGSMVRVNYSHAYVLMDGAFIVTKGTSGQTVAEDFDLNIDTPPMG